MVFVQMDITLYCSLSLDAIHQFNCIMHYRGIFIILHDIVNSYYHYFIHLITVGDKKNIRFSCNSHALSFALFQLLYNIHSAIFGSTISLCLS